MATTKNSVNIDLTIPSTATQSNNKYNVLLAQETTSHLCPKHEREYQLKNKDGGEGATSKKLQRKSHTKKNSKPSNFSKMQSVFGKSSLQKKLDHHGIKIKVGFVPKRKIAPVDGDERLLISASIFLSYYVKSPKKQSEEVCFLLIQHSNYIIILSKNTLLQTVFSPILPTGQFMEFYRNN